MESLTFHKYANLFPMMTEGELDALRASMRANGYRAEFPVILYEGAILDGRNRYTAAMTESIEPVYTEFTGSDPLGYVIDSNLTRRHLNETQRAIVANSIANMKRGEHVSNAPIGAFVSQPIAAKMLNVSKRTVQRVASIECKAPDLLPAMQSGEMSAHEADKIAKQREREQDRTRAAYADAFLAASAKQKKTVNQFEWWQLGRHTLYCGDTSDAAFTDALKPAAFSFADPPYNAAVADWDSDFCWQHDYLIDKAAVVAVTPGIVSIFDFARKIAMPYVWSAACWIDNGMTRGAMGFGNWIYAAIFSHGSIHRGAQDFFKVSIDISETGETNHKGRKPFGFVAYLVKLYSDAGDTVIDPFLGSGTTLFVCEEYGRCCIGGDISPEYCTDIVNKWELKTGLEARKVIG